MLENMSFKTELLQALKQKQPRLLVPLIPLRKLVNCTNILHNLVLIIIEDKTKQTKEIQSESERERVKRRAKLFKLMCVCNFGKV